VTAPDAAIDPFRPDPAWPLRVAASGRHLEDALGRPYRLDLDSGWFAPTEFWLEDPASAAEWAAYLDDRQAKGFTGVLMMGMVNTKYNAYASHIQAGHYDHLPANRISGVAPLAVPGDFSTPVPAYWENVRALIAAARDRGMVVLLAYQYLGYPTTGEGWRVELESELNSVASQRAFGTWLVELLAECPNTLWYPWGDDNPPPGEVSRRVRASIEAIRAAQPHGLFAAELHAPDDTIAENPDADELLDMNSFYGFGPGQKGAVWKTARKAWAHRPVRPAWVCEPQYEAAEIGGSGSAADVREAEWFAVVDGGTAGQVYGAVGIYNFPMIATPAGPPWREVAQYPGARQAAVQFAFWADLPWWAFVPSGAEEPFLGIELVVRGQDDGSHDGRRHIAAAGTPDGRHVVAYIPGRDAVREFALDLGALPGPARAEWVDPVSGARADARADAGAVAAGIATFATPGANADGATDWVLLVRAD